MEGTHLRIAEGALQVKHRASLFSQGMYAPDRFGQIASNNEER